MDSKQYKRFIFIIFIFALLGFLFYALWPFANAFLGAAILYVLFKPVYNYLTIKRKFGKISAAMLILIVSLFVIIIPFLIIILLVTGEVLSIVNDPKLFSESISFIGRFAANLGFEDILTRQISTITGYISNLFVDLLSGIGNFVIQFIIMYFTLFYLLTKKISLREKLGDFIPFNSANTAKLVKEFKNIANSSIVSTGVIAVLQGILLTIGFMIFNVSNPLLWGFVTVIVSFLPVIGPPIIWVPAVIVKFAQGNYIFGAGLLIWGIVLSTGDNFLRPYLQEKMGKIHPLVSLIGVFIGLPLFGLLGIVVGPLLISYALLTVRMFKEEHIR